MRRISVHLAFALLAAGCGATALVEGLRLQRLERLNGEIVAAGRSIAAPPLAGRSRDAHAPVAADAGSRVDPAATAGSNERSGAGAASAGAASSAVPDTPAAAPAGAPREVRLARAIALAEAGFHDTAFKEYNALIAAPELDAVGRQALFNLANMVLRQGLAAGAPGGPGVAPKTSAEAAPLIELAKQRYRDLLRAAPDDWDARYNLERALRAAPEEHEAFAEAPNEPVERRRITLRGMAAGDLP